MSASLHSSSSASLHSCAGSLCAKPSAACVERASKTLRVGIVNNMPDGALEATERQFLSLLDSASEGLSIQVSLYSMSDIPRGKAVERHVQERYRNMDELWNTQLDALIVTGREPLAQNLKDESYWQTFTRLVAWADANTISTIWSCLAAHAAVLFLDGIPREKSGQKHCGLMECDRMAEHPLTDGIAAAFRIPHSRWNGLSQDALQACGYGILSTAGAAGVDMFVKQYNSMFVFLQGHPEYDANTLLLEYRRDIGRYARGESEAYPRLPQNYFDAETAAALEQLRHEASQSVAKDLSAKANAILDEVILQNSWRSSAVALYSNWLTSIRRQKWIKLQTSLRLQPQSDPIPALSGASAPIAQLVAAAPFHAGSTASLRSKLPVL